MPDLTIGAVVQTSRGVGTLVALTPMQARVRPHDGEDPYWILRSAVAIVDQVEEEREPTMLELLDSAYACIELVRMQVAQQQAKEESDAKPG